MIITRGLKDISNLNVENNKFKQVKEFHFYFSRYLEVTLNKKKYRARRNKCEALHEIDVISP